MKREVLNLAMGVFSLGLICSCSSDEDGGGSSGGITADQLKGTWISTQKTDVNGNVTYDITNSSTADYEKAITFDENGAIRKYEMSKVSGEYDKHGGSWVLNDNLLTARIEDTVIWSGGTGISVHNLKVVIAQSSKDRIEGSFEYYGNNDLLDKGNIKLRKILNSDDELWGTWKTKQGDTTIQLKSYEEAIVEKNGVSGSTSWKFDGQKLEVAENGHYIFFKLSLEGETMMLIATSDNNYRLYKQ